MGNLNMRVIKSIPNFCNRTPGPYPIKHFSAHSNDIGISLFKRILP